MASPPPPLRTEEGRDEEREEEKVKGRVDGWMDRQSTAVLLLSAAVGEPVGDGPT